MFQPLRMDKGWGNAAAAAAVRSRAEQQEKWYFSIVDVIAVLTDSPILESIGAS